MRTLSFKVVTQHNVIQHSGRIMATYSGPMIMERPFTLAQYPNFTSCLLSPIKNFLFPSWYYFKFCEVFGLLVNLLCHPYIPRDQALRASLDVCS